MTSSKKRLHRPEIEPTSVTPIRISVTAYSMPVGSAKARSFVMSFVESLSCPSALIATNRRVP